VLRSKRHGQDGRATRTGGGSAELFCNSAALDFNEAGCRKKIRHADPAKWEKHLLCLAENKADPSLRSG
jgi:hypothetical protein